jgi:hypothetical protein
MAKRILVATLYKTSSSDYLLNVSPSCLKANCKDQVFLIVKLDSSVSRNGDSIQCFIDWDPSTANPFQSNPNFPTSLDSIAPMGSLLLPVNVEFTLNIAYNGNTYSEDPEMEIKG